MPEFFRGALIADVQTVEHRVEESAVRAQQLAVDLLHIADAEPLLQNRCDGLCSGALRIKLRAFSKLSRGISI